MLALSEEDLHPANLAELRMLAVKKAKPSAPKKQQLRNYRIRSAAIAAYVLRRSEGICEGCDEPAPFDRADGSPYLEPHHTDRLADDGPDHPAKVIALCPNSHRRAHSSHDAIRFNQSLKKRLMTIESE